MDARQDNKRIALNTIFLYLRQLLVMVISLYTSRLVLKELGVEDFGIYNVIGGFVALLSVISGSLSAAMSRFYTFELGRKDINQLRLVFSTSISVLLTLAIIIFVLGEILGTWAINDFLVIPSSRHSIAYIVLQASIVAFIFNLLSSPFSGAIMAYEKMKTFAYFGVFDAVCKFIIAFSLRFVSCDKLEVFSILQTFLSLILLLSYVIYCKKHLEGCTLSVRFDKNVFYSLSKYASWSMFGMMSFVGYTYGYNIILNIFFGPVVNAARGVAVQVQNAIMGFANNFQASMNPQIIKNYANENLERMHALVLACSRYSFYLMLLLALPVILEADVILGVWLVEIPPHTVAFVRIVLFTICIEVLAGPLICSQNATGNIKMFQIATGLTLLFSLPVCYLAFKLGATPEYLYYIYTLFTLITLVIRIYITCPYVGISINKYIKEVISNVILVSVLSLPIPLLVYYSLRNVSLHLIIVCISSVICVSIVVFYVGMRQNERQLVISKLSNMYKQYFGHANN